MQSWSLLVHLAGKDSCNYNAESKAIAICLHIIHTMVLFVVTVYGKHVLVCSTKFSSASNCLVAMNYIIEITK